MSENNIPHIVDQGASFTEIQPGYIGNLSQATFIQPPKKAGCWIIGGDFHVYVQKKVTNEQIKATEELLGWVWKDGDFNDHCK